MTMIRLRELSDIARVIRLVLVVGIARAPRPKLAKHSLHIVAVADDTITLRTPLSRFHSRLRDLYAVRTRESPIDKATTW